jgi:class 3 adenylate cyclase
MGDISDTLSAFPVFAKFTPDELKILSQFLTITPFTPGKILMKKGEDGTYLGILLRGEADIIDENVLIVTRGPGAILGEMALIRSSPRMADVVAAGDGEMALMQFEKIGQFKQEHLNVALKLVGLLTESTLRKLAETEAALRAEKQKSEQLLLNILPRRIAEDLKRKPDAIAEQFNEATILFADIVGFTPLSSTMSAIELVNFLNQIFSAFDQLADWHGLEKIKTIGDAYMAVGGIPVPRDDHAEAVAKMALGMQEVIGQLNAILDQAFQIRIGINTGSGVAGVIGVKKFIYDLWGDTVNVASRMESSGIPGRIQVTPEIYQHLQHAYILEERGTINVKGKGAMQTYWLIGKREVA